MRGSRAAAWAALVLLACTWPGHVDLVAADSPAAEGGSSSSGGALDLGYQEIPGRLIVKLRPDVVVAMDANSNGLSYSRNVGLPNAAVYTITDGKSVAEKLQEISQHPAIEFAEPDYRVSVQWKPNDSLFSAQWHHKAVSSQSAWDSSTGNDAVKVCHIDSGIRLDHPDLAGRVAKGWNLVPEVQEFDADSPAPDSPEYTNINDTYGHGTHTAGIIAAVGNNKLGVAGIAMDVRLLVCRFIWDDGYGSISDALECLRLCREEGAMISSNSWGGVPHSQAIEEGLADAKKAGMLFVVASGNRGINIDKQPSYPASSKMDNMIVVGSSERTDDISDFSNNGRGTVHLLAPGRQILSTMFNKWYGPMDGTSMACPLVSGAAALLQSAALSQGATLTYADLRLLLLSSVDPSPGKSAATTMSGGRLNIGTAMLALSLLLQERGLQALPHTYEESSPEGAELRDKLVSNQFGKQLLAPRAGGQAVMATPAAAVPGMAGMGAAAGPAFAPSPAAESTVPASLLSQQQSSEAGTSPSASAPAQLPQLLEQQAAAGQAAPAPSPAPAALVGAASAGQWINAASVVQSGQAHTEAELLSAQSIELEQQQGAQQALAQQQQQQAPTTRPKRSKRQHKHMQRLRA